MSKRKRNDGDDTLAQNGGTTKIKKQKVKGLVEVGSDKEGSRKLHTKASQSQDSNPDHSKRTAEETARARKLENIEKRRLKREQQAVHEAQDHGEDVLDAREGRKEGPKETDVQSKPMAEEVTQSQKLGKRERRKLKRRQQEALRVLDQGNQEQPAGEIGKRRIKQQKQKYTHEGNGRPDENNGWKVSDSIGGHLLNIDPIFSSAEDHLLLAYNSTIVVYSTATSLAVRHLRTKNSASISAFALSSQKDYELYVSTQSGAIEKWNWKEGSRIGYWRLSSSIYSLTTSASKAEEGDNNDLVYTVDKKDKGPWLISAHRLRSGNDRLRSGNEASKTGVKTLFSHRHPISYMRVSEGGRYIIAASGPQLIIGNTKTPDLSALQDLSYTWRILDCPEWITSADVHITHAEKKVKKSGAGKKLIDYLTVCIGGLKGSIHIYDDLLGALLRREQPASKENHGDILSRRLHWHRNAVLALKWSLDGNYLISGGEETVLVLWQLETGRRQDLPHLGAPIESVVVSPSGSSYALRLTDNSAMILSTTELQPTFSVAGIQLPSARKDNDIKLPFVPTVNTPYQESRGTQRLNAAACTSLSQPGSLLLAVPSSISTKSTASVAQSTPYLQTFDIGTGHQISRQALTRTKVTDLNMGPESNNIEEPSVVFMQTSVDGSWLATVDEWIPPLSDLDFLAFDKEHMIEEQNFRKETYLKFWAWKDESTTWELVSRIDEPHSSRSLNPYNEMGICGLVSDPSSVGFGTVGTDGTVKIWKPNARLRNGLVIRNEDGQSLTSWRCKHVVSLEIDELGTESKNQDARLAYSQDGSILVGAFQSSATSSAYIIDAIDGELRDIQTDLFDGPILGLGILNKYLITLSNELRVIDLVKGETHYGIDLRTYGLSLDKQLSMSHLALNANQGLFAVALPKLQKATRNPASQLAIFDPAIATPLFLTSSHNPVTALLANAGRKGFVAVDSAAEVRTLVPSQPPRALNLAVAKAENAHPRTLNGIFGTGNNTKALQNGANGETGLLGLSPKVSVVEPRVRDSDPVIVSQDRLAEVFDVGPAYALPPVTDLFEQVASLYSGQKMS